MRRRAIFDAYAPLVIACLFGTDVGVFAWKLGWF